MSEAVLVLEDGTVFRGRGFGAEGETLGEAVFFTGMTGYQEILTDPGHHGQIVVATFPQIGNTGWNSADGESLGDDGVPDGRIRASGYVVRETSPTVSSWRSDRGGLEDEMVRQGLVGIRGVDTRAVVRHLRGRGAMRAGIFSGASAGPVDALLRTVRARPGPDGQDAAGAVATRTGYRIDPAGGGAARYEVAALDLGLAASVVRRLADTGYRVHVLPPGATAAQVDATGAQGLFLAGGPGDPGAMDPAVQLTREVVGAGTPTVGIGLGNQILGRALGMRTHRMAHAHRGTNIPVIEEATGRVAITAQNHGFALEGERGQEFDTPFGRARVSHVCANDGSVDGVELADGRAFSVQYQPRTVSGPHDARHLFARFSALMDQRKAGQK